MKTPKGSSVRPTSDKVRGAIFSILVSQGRDPADAAVLDLFAGTGALGIEALSRGAARAVFVEKDGRTADLCRENVELCGFAESGSILRADAERLDLATLGKFDIVFADPPYALVPGSKALAALAVTLAEGGVAMVEHGTDAPPPVPAGLEAFDAREYGDTGLTFYRRRS